MNLSRLSLSVAVACMTACTGGLMDPDGAVEGDASSSMDASTQPEPCDEPGAIESIACGACGMAERFCTSALIWEVSACTGEGECVPGTSETTACGMCGRQTQRCGVTCAWERIGDCTDEGECLPGATMTSADGCGPGEVQDFACTSECVFEPLSGCAADTCDPPGTTETVACGMCGTEERFCNSSGVWSRGPCTGEGSCVPGTTRTVPCGMCGTQPARCDAGCAWEATDLCAGEGECSPGATTHSSVGCPVGQTQPMTCDTTCSFSPSGSCEVVGPLPLRLVSADTLSCSASIHWALERSRGTRGGIAASDADGGRFYYMGDRGGVSALTAGANGLRATSEQIGLFGDLETRTVYAFTDGGVPVVGPCPTRVDGFQELHPAMLNAAGPVIPLSSPISIDCSAPQRGVFAGREAVVLHDGANAHAIQIPTGQVTDLGPVSIANMYQCLGGWAAWGIAESFGGDIYLTYRAGTSPARIERISVTTGVATTVQALPLVRALCSWTVDLTLSRWMWEYNAPSDLDTFTGFGPVLGSCSAVLTTTP